MIDFEGFTNFDTWEAYNVLNENIFIKSELEMIAADGHITYFRMMVIKALSDYYLINNFDITLQAIPRNINYFELKRAFLADD